MLAGVSQRRKKGEHLLLQMKWRRMLCWSCVVAKVNPNVFNQCGDEKGNVRHSGRLMSSWKHYNTNLEESK